MQRTTWKDAEWREYGEAARNGCATISRDIGVDCVGMSSLGPMLFCLGEITALLDEVVRQQDALDCKIVRTAPRQCGPHEDAGVTCVI